jgi:sucrose synthase
MECEMLENIRQQGLDIKPQIVVVTRLIPNAHGTSCNQRVEKIIGTKHSFILRVPFRHKGCVLRNWVSRFDVYPFLEQFVMDVAKELSTELKGEPDLIIGNYTDGNLVASLLSHRLGVTQVFFFLFLFLLGFMLSIAVTISCYLLSCWWWYITP